MSTTSPTYHSRIIHGVASGNPEQVGRPSVEQLIAKYEREGVRGRQDRCRPWSGHKPPLTPEELAEIHRLRAAGQTLSQIGERFGRHASTIANAVGNNRRFDRRRRREGAAA